MWYMLPTKVAEATSRNKHRRSLDGFFFVWEGYWRSFWNRRQADGARSTTAIPKHWFINSVWILCAVHFGNGEGIQTTCLQWAKCCFVVNYQSRKRFFPLGKVHAPPLSSCFCCGNKRKGAWAQMTKQGESDEQGLRLLTERCSLILLN